MITMITILLCVFGGFIVYCIVGALLWKLIWNITSEPEEGWDDVAEAEQKTFWAAYWLWPITLLVALFFLVCETFEIMKLWIFAPRKTVEKEAKKAKKNLTHIEKDLREQ